MWIWELVLCVCVRVCACVCVCVLRLGLGDSGSWGSLGSTKFYLMFQTCDLWKCEDTTTQHTWSSINNNHQSGARSLTITDLCSACEQPDSYGMYSHYTPESSFEQWHRRIEDVCGAGAKIEKKGTWCMWWAPACRKLSGTLPPSVHWKGTLEGHSPCFIYHRGIWGAFL